MSTISAKRLGDLQRVPNTNPHWAANDHYNYIRVELESGQEIPLLLSDAEVERAHKRALKNAEDLPKISKVRDLLD